MNADKKNDQTALNTEDTPQTVATIDVKIHWPTAEQWREEFIDDHLNCCLCGTALKFDHKVDHIAHVVTENAACPSCGVKERQTTHCLQ